MNIKQWQVWGALFTLIFGTLLHFTYALSGQNPVVGIFSPVNESVWEHLKLLFTPMLLFAEAEYYFYGKDLPNFVPVRVFSMLLGMCTVVVSFYTYVGIIGQHYPLADIGFFILSVLLAYWFSYLFLESDCFSSRLANLFGWIGLVLLIAAFILFSFNPPHIPLFEDSGTGTYGIPIE